MLAAEADQPAEPAEVQAARRSQRELPVELDRVLAAIRAGMDPDLATATTRQIKRELAAAEATIAAWEHANQPSLPLTADNIKWPSTTPATSPDSWPRPSAKRGPGSTGPSISC